MDIRADAFAAILTGVCAVALAAARADDLDLRRALTSTFLRGVVADIRAHAAHREHDMLEETRRLLGVCIRTFEPRRLAFAPALFVMSKLGETARFRARFEELSAEDTGSHARKTGQNGRALLGRAHEIDCHI